MTTSDILVVIGYSFPIFNRQVDKQLFDQMTNVRKVYIQDPNAKAIESTMINAFKIFQLFPTLGEENVNFQLEGKGQFIIPRELI